MGIIRTLPRELVEKIAAGEIIERPASVVKELIENAIDAGALSIRIEIQAGGRERIAVIDDGCGMDACDAELCVFAHATSKLATATDLWKIRTLGFRGEALAAIAQVSRCVVETKLREGHAQEGTRVVVVQGTKEEVRPVGCPSGTSISVADLFFNVPARRKFLKSDGVEYGAIAEVVMGLALAHPRVRFELHRDLKRHLVYPQADELLRRMTDVVGREIAADVMLLSAKSDGIAMSGYVGSELVSRSSAKSLYLSVNGRPLRDRLLLHAVTEGYGERMPRGRYPVAVLDIQIDPEMIDVNVHPTKREIRFEQGRAVHEFISRAVSKAIVSSPSPARLFLSLLEPREGGTFSPPTYVGAPLPGICETPLGLRVLGQLDRTYLVCEGEQGKLVLVDQHAADERLGFETLKRQWMDGRIVQQRLLIPQQVLLKPHAFAILSEQLEMLCRAGFDVEPFGGESLLVKAVPALIADTELQTLFERVALEIEEIGKTWSADLQMERVLIVIACHRQIRGGDVLSEAEMNALLHRMKEAGVTHCPHGRPVVVTFERQEIERRFKRS